MSFQQHYPQFHRIILQDKNLRIPKKYVDKFWKGISNPIFLRFPNGVEQEIFWVKKSNGEIWFQKNWDQFAKSFKYGNLLTFKYIGGSCFKVKIFCPNALEINYSNIKSIVEEEEEIVEVSDESELHMQAQRTGNGKRKMNMDLDSTQQKLSVRNREGMVKKAKKCSATSAAVYMRNNNQNPFFDVIMTKTHADGKSLSIPCKFSREHLKNFQGIATLFVGEEMAMEVKIIRSSIISAGWKSFSEKYNLQVGDVCKFVMTQRQPLSFNIIINRAQRTGNGKRKINVDLDSTQQKLSDSNREGIVKKAKKCSTTSAAVTMRDNTQNPFFDVIMIKSYIDGNYLRIPDEFSREHLNKFQEIATLFVGEEMVMEVNMRFDYNKKISIIGTGWKLFSEKYNLQVDDACKFVMTQRQPLLFNIIINRARKGPNPKGCKEEISCDNNVVKMEVDTGESSRSRPEVHFSYGGCDVMKHNTFKVLVNGNIPIVPKEFMNRGSRHNYVVLKMEEQSRLVKVTYYGNTKCCKFRKGWKQFMEDCKIEIGDTCLFELIDEKKFVFNVSIVRKNHRVA